MIKKLVAFPSKEAELAHSYISMISIALMNLEMVDRKKMFSLIKRLDPEMNKAAINLDCERLSDILNQIHNVLFKRGVWK